MAVVFGGGSRKSLALVLATSQLLACSFIAEPPPGSAHELRPDRDGYACGRSFLYPVADTISTGASITWIVRANDELDTHRRDSEGDRWRFARVAGWVSLGVFGASAIYGYFVEGRCARIRKERELAKTLPPAATRRAFPSSVFGFGFRRQRAELAQVCVSKDAQWSMEGTVARCRPRNESVPEVRIAFELGVSSEIRTVFVGAAAAENRDYQSLADGLRKFYGPPDVQASAFSAACQASLAQCLGSGERPKGPAWHWAAGTIELSLLWADERAVLEVRYALEDAAR